jgi:hypothetical protein
VVAVVAVTPQPLQRVLVLEPERLQQLADEAVAAQSRPIFPRTSSHPALART